MEREGLVDIWFVFTSWEIVVNYGDFIRVTCILCVDMSENLKLRFGYTLG